MINYPVRSMFLDDPSNNMISRSINKFKKLRKKRKYDNKRGLIRRFKRPLYK